MASCETGFLTHLAHTRKHLVAEKRGIFQKSDSSAATDGKGWAHGYNEHAQTENGLLTFVIPAVVGVTVGRMLPPALGGLSGAGTPFVPIAFPTFGQIRVNKFHVEKDFCTLFFTSSHH